MVARNPQQGVPVGPQARTNVTEIARYRHRGEHLRFVLGRTDDDEAAAKALAGGAVVAHGFANFYVITTRQDVAMVRRVNRLKDRPPTQVGSITTTPRHIPSVFDFSQLPAGVSRVDVLALFDELFARGPFGVRGPAADHIPDHLARMDGDIRTAQVIAPGYACMSNDFLARSLAETGTDHLFITSANRSRHLSGAPDEPAHFLASGLQEEFGSDPRFLVLEHADEDMARLAYPRYLPMSTTILAFHRLAGDDAGERRTLVLERHGSLHVDEVRRIVAPLGFDVELGPLAQRRLAMRSYDAFGSTELPSVRAGGLR